MAESSSVVAENNSVVAEQQSVVAELQSVVAETAGDTFEFLDETSVVAETAITGSDDAPHVVVDTLLASLLAAGGNESGAPSAENVDAADDTTPVVAGNTSIAPAAENVDAADDTTPVVAGNEAENVDSSDDTTPVVAAPAAEKVDAADDPTPVVAGNTSTATATTEIFPGCFAGNRPFPRETESLPIAFEIDPNSEAPVARKQVYETANFLLKYLREKADEKRTGQPAFYEVDLTQAEPIQVPIPQRYTEEVRKQFDEKYWSAIGAQYFYEDRSGKSVVAEYRPFCPKEFVQTAVRSGDVQLDDDNEVVRLEFRLWSGSIDDTTWKCNQACVWLDLEPPVEPLSFMPPLCDIMVYLRKGGRIRLHPNAKGELTVQKYHNKGYEKGYHFPAMRLPKSGKGAMQKHQTAAREGDDPNEPVGQPPFATFSPRNPR